MQETGVFHVLKLFDCHKVHGFRGRKENYIVMSNNLSKI